MNSSDSLNASALQKSFSQYSTDEMDTTNDENSIKLDVLNSEINGIMDFKSKHKLSLKSSADLAALFNSKVNSQVVLPTKTSNLKKTQTCVLCVNMS